MKIFYIISAVFFAVFITTSCILLSLPNITHIEKGDCFDRYGNKINDVTCDVVVNEGVAPEYHWLTYLLLISIGISILSLFTQGIIDIFVSGGGV